MFEVIAILCLVLAVLLLCALSFIDLKSGLLPNEYVLAFGLAGAVFHITTAFHYLSLIDMAVGLITGGALLYLVRTAANFYYKQDALGLGDVKLMAAAGLWLGPYYVLLSLSAGAFAGLLHGAGIALHKKVSFKNLSLPAGPGFAIGIFLVGLYQFHNVRNILWP